MKALAIVLWQVTALPLLWLAWLHVRGHRRARAWWVMASAFGVAWVANLFGFIGRFDEASQTYPVLLAALFAMTMLPRWGAAILTTGLFWTAVFSIAVRHGIGFDVWLHVLAFGSTAVVADLTLPRSRLRATLTWGFAALAVLWPLSVHLTAWPLATYLAYHGAWVVLVLAWCDAAWREAV